jgi:plasmid replication initiation protein
MSKEPSAKKAPPKKVAKAVPIEPVDSSTQKDSSKSAGVAVVANQIIEGSHRLSSNQTKLIYYGISKIDSKNDKTVRTFSLKATEFATLIGREGDGSIYPEMKKLSVSLMKQVINIARRNDAGKAVVDSFQWVSKCRYNEETASVDMTFHEEMAPYLVDLKKSFTQLRVEKIAMFRSFYTIRFYERISMMGGLKQETWTMAESELRRWLSIETGTYPMFSYLRRFVIDVAQAELNRSADFSFTYTFKKKSIGSEGTKQAVIEFTICQCASADMLFAPPKEIDYSTSACVARLKASTKPTRELVAKICRKQNPDTQDMETEAIIGGLQWGQSASLPAIFRELDADSTIDA